MENFNAKEVRRIADNATNMEEIGNAVINEAQRGDYVLYLKGMRKVSPNDRDKLEELGFKLRFNMNGEVKEIHW